MTIITWDSINKGSGVKLSNGNLTAYVANMNNSVRATEGKNSGKWYWEVSFSSLQDATVGIIDNTISTSSSIAKDSHARMYYSLSGEISYPRGSYGVSYKVGDIIGVKLDLDNNILEFLVNNISQGNITNFRNDLVGDIFPAISSWASSSGSTSTVNFGASPFVYGLPVGYLPYDNETAKKFNARICVKNPTTNQHYSLAEKTLIILPDSSSKNMILHGVEVGREIKLDEPFNKIRTITDNGDGTQTVTDETVDPFSVYDYISENPQVLVYTESEDDITLSTSTEPFTLYDEFGDEVEVLFFTDDDTVTDANLILEANWSPIDELEGNFEVVTWTDETDSTRTLELNGIPSPKFITKTTVSNIGGTLSGIILNDSSTPTTSSNVRFLLTNNNSTWYKWNGTNFVNVTYSKVSDILTLGNTYTELANADYSKWTHSKINIGVFLKDDDTTSSKVNELGIITNSPIRTSQVSDLNFYILNTTAKIELDLKGLWLSGQLSDLDLTRVQYRVFLNEQPYYPLDGKFTNLDNPPLNIDITFKSEEIKINDWNTLRVEFKDSFGTVDYWQTTFVGNYSSLMFTDTDGNYYSDDVGKVLQYLDFGTFFGGQYSVEHEVVIKNQYGYDVENLMIEASTGHLPEGVEVQFSDTASPFTPQADLLLPNELKNDDEVSFYIRMISDIDSVPNGENKFNIFVKAERKV